jgi:MFS family permease
VDPTGYDDVYRWLAYLHPAWMVASLALAILALRAGMEMRRRRLSGRRGDAELIRRHVRMARPAVALVTIGFGGGVVSAIFLREWESFATFHAWLGLLSAGLFATAGVLGAALMKGRRDRLQAHGIAGLLAVLAAAVATVAGFVLLP